VAPEGLDDVVFPAGETAAKRLADFVSDAAIDQMITDAKDAGISLLDGPGGLIGQLSAGDRAGAGRGNGRSPRLYQGRPGGNGSGEFSERLFREDDDVGPG
jgi:hypothetical protein